MSIESAAKAMYAAYDALKAAEKYDAHGVMTEAYLHAHAAYAAARNDYDDVERARAMAYVATIRRA